jgi:transcriptional regulator with XRE-family HTH domain
MARRIVVPLFSSDKSRLQTSIPKILEELGRRITKLRRRRGFSQEGFAEACGLHRTAVGLLERGESIPRLDTLLLVSQGLGISTSELLSDVSAAVEWSSAKPGAGS